jgi:hypothetical protein
MDYEQKYLKYKAKYLQLKSLIEGGQENSLTEENMVGGGTHRMNFLRKHKLEDKGYSLPQLSRISGISVAILQKVYDRGSGAYKTNRTSVRMKGTFKKNVNAPYRFKLSKEQWAMARVYSFLDGNPKHDTDLRRKGGSETESPKNN